MMCSRCKGAMQDPGETLEKWGNVNYCGFCANLMRKYSNGWSDFPEICISEKPRFWVAAEYDFIYGKIILIKNHEKITNIISHEIMHHVLFKRVGLEACFKYDNISGFGELDGLFDYRGCE